MLETDAEVHNAASQDDLVRRNLDNRLDRQRERNDALAHHTKLRLDDAVLEPRRLGVCAVRQEENRSRKAKIIDPQAKRIVG